MLNAVESCQYVIWIYLGGGSNGGDAVLPDESRSSLLRLEYDVVCGLDGFR